MAHLVVTVLLWMFVATGVWYVSSRSQDARLRTLRAKTDSSRTTYDTARTLAMQAQYVTKEAAKEEQRHRRALTVQLSQLRDSIRLARSVADDSAATADSLRSVLRATLQQTDSLLTQVHGYVVVVDSLTAAHARERLAMTAALDRADSTIALQNVLIRALETRECRILGRPCPTRTQVFLAGATLGIVLGLAR